jgi:diphthine synthase
VPFPQKNWSPTSSIDVIAQNLSLQLHTLVYLDIQDTRFMTVPEAIILLERMAEEKKIHLPLYVGIARAGSDDPLVRAGPAAALKPVNFGPPLHILVVPADLHEMERAYLEMFAGL